MDKHDHHSGGFGNGFLLGLIVGAAVVFFLFTKRGKQMLKVISEEGLEGIEDLKGLIDFDEEEEDYEDIPPVTPTKPILRAEEVVSSVGQSAKRFFRGVPKRKYSSN